MGISVELRTSSSIDLMYHGLAHLPLNNPANLYSKAYLERCGSSKQLRERLESLAPWYTAHFERLCSVGFLPFFAPALKSNPIIEGNLLFHTTFQQYIPYKRYGK